jgi:MOSC domain-containing protein YiiM
MQATDPNAPSAAALGVVKAIFIAEAGGQPMRAVQSVQAVAGRGLEGDRYFEARGTFSASGGGGREITLIDAAALEAFEDRSGRHLPPGASRRNLVTRGIDLNSLVGKQFWIGAVLCRGVRLCPPCGHLERLSGSGLAQGLLGRGGLRAEIVEGGPIQAGDPIGAEA